METFKSDKKVNFEKHCAKCKICKEWKPEVREQMENDFLNWTSITEIVEKYKDEPGMVRTKKEKEIVWYARRFVDYHFLAKGLYRRRNNAQDSEECFATQQMQKANETARVTARDGLSAAKLKAQLKKKIGDVTPVNVNYFNQRFFGDLSQLSQSELDGEIIIVKDLIDRVKGQKREAIECEATVSDVGKSKEES